MKTKPKLIAIVGPTASGKSALAVHLAKKIGGEIVSIDSRQVYKGLDIGTGKITAKEMRGVPHHLLDVADARKQFSIEQFRTKARKAIGEIIKRGHTPILCGGSGFYLATTLGEMSFLDVPPNKALRKRLGKFTVLKLFQMLQKLDPARATAIDRRNPVRLIRAIEIAKALGHVPNVKKEPEYESLKIGVLLPDKTLRKNITIRLFARIREGMVGETKRLHTQGLSWKRMEALGLEYRHLARFLQKTGEDLGDISPKNRRYIAYNTMLRELETAIWHYAKRQKTWFKRDKKIQWFNATELKTIESRVNKFLRK